MESPSEPFARAEDYESKRPKANRFRPVPLGERLPGRQCKYTTSGEQGKGGVILRITSLGVDKCGKAGLDYSVDGGTIFPKYLFLC